MFRNPECAYGYYKIKDDYGVEEMATKALIPLIQASTLRAKETMNIPVNSMRDVKRLMHSSDPRMRRKAERMSRKLAR